MDKSYIHILIAKFFGNDLSPEIQKKFHTWLLDENFQKEKEKALAALWEEDPAVADDSTFQELEQLHKRMKTTDRQLYKSIGLYVRRIAAILLLPLLGAFGTYFYLTEINPVVEKTELVECSTSYGEKRQITLSDGTVVWLNAGSLLVYEKDFKGATRTLFLSGEANFKVAKNPRKPFIVNTKYMDVEALGTIFNVQSYPDSPNTIATLEEGKIKVDTKYPVRQSFIIKPNEQVVYNHINKKVSFSKVDANKCSYWKQGYLIFQGATFGEIVQTIERSFGVTVNYEAGRYKERTFTIKFTPDEGLEHVMDILQKIIGFKYKVENNNVFIY